MATLSTRSKPQALSNQVATLLLAYESFRLDEDVPGISGYTMTLRTNIYVHRVHTQRDKFTPTSFYVGASLSALPSMGFIEQWLKNARESTLKHINEGVYQHEEIIGGEWQMVKGRYNRWLYYDGVNRQLVGHVQVITAAKSHPETKLEVQKNATRKERQNHGE